MGRLYEWKVKSVRKANSEDLSDVIIGTQWKCIGTDEETGLVGEFNGATPFSMHSINTGSFITYEDLTEEVVIGWIKNVASSSNDIRYWEHIDGVITKEINKQKYEHKEVPGDLLPWYTGSVMTYPTASMPPI
jgi:hypothetical protein